MKIMDGYFLIVFYVFGLANLGIVAGQCCPIDNNPTLSILNLPDSIRFSKSLEECDKISCRYSQALENHFRDGDFDALNEEFSMFVNEVNRQELIGEGELEVVYKYGRMLHKLGRTDKSNLLNEFIIDHKKSTPFLKTIAKFGLKNFYGVDVVGDDFFDGFDREMQDFNDSEKLQALLIALYHSSTEGNYDLIDYYFDLIVEAKEGDPYRAIILKASYQILNAHKDERISKIVELQTNNLVVHNPVFSHWMEIEEAESNRDYARKLEVVKEVLESEYGHFDSVHDLLERIIDSELPMNGMITEFANVSLLQTRLGKGLPPVVDAFNIYQTVYRHNLREKYATLLKLVADPVENFDYTSANILIIGNYLYQQTNELHYLSNAIEILDGYSGAGALFWVKAREQMRIDESFKKQLEEIKGLNRKLSDEAGTISLQELHARMMEVWEMEDDFKERYHYLFTGDYSEADIDLEELQNEMAADSAAMIAFYSNGRMLYRLFVSCDTVTVKILNEDMREILDLADRLPYLISKSSTSAEADEISYRLYSLLLGDLEAELPSRLHFLGTGPLTKLPFSGLRTTESSAPPRYLGTDHAISIQFSIGSMRALRNLRLNPQYAHPLGMAPTFGNNFLAAGELRQAGYALPPLLYSQDEIKNLQGISAGRYLYGDQASLVNYRKHADDHGIIHLASHAISSQDDGIRSRVYLMNDEGDPAPLYADDIGSETLNADLVVLSACETGGGEEHPLEGRVGLTKAYLAAGARSVVSSSWAVDDYATAEMMGTFYSAVAAGIPPSEALRQARSDYRGHHPDAPVARWAAFEAYGGMQPVRWEPEADYSFWWYALAAGLAGLVAVFFGWRLYGVKS